MDQSERSKTDMRILSVPQLHPNEYMYQELDTGLDMLIKSSPPNASLTFCGGRLVEGRASAPLWSTDYCKYVAKNRDFRPGHLESSTHETSQLY
jgi:hypothetical protein